MASTEQEPKMRAESNASVEKGECDAKTHDSITGRLDSDATTLEAPVERRVSAEGEGNVYPSGSRLALIMATCAISLFIVSLDTTIISTAIPSITDEFHSLADAGWYGSAFLLTFAAFQALWGKAYKCWSIKLVYILAILLFELGSLICAVSPNSDAFIVGRAVAGVGGAGVASGSYLIIGISVPLPKMPKYQGLMGASYAIASIAGPLVGGAFTSNVTWRWCFYLNLPVGGVSVLAVVLFFHVPPHAKPIAAPLREKLLHLDPVGAILLLGAIVCFLLGLQWGGVTKPWGSADVIGVLVGAALILIVFAGLEVILRERAAIRFTLLRNKTIAIMFAFQFIIAGAFFSILYYLPYYFQVVDGASAAQSGIRIIPFVAFGSVFTIILGFWLTRTGEFQIVMLIGAALVSVGSGLMYTLKQGSSTGEWVGYQILGGIGLGITLQLCVTIGQSVVDPTDLAEVSALALFFQLISGAIWISVSQSLFTNRLVHGLAQNVKGVSPGAVVAGGATELRTIIPADQLPGAIQSFLEGLRAVFILSSALAAAAAGISVCALLFDRRRLKTGSPTAVTT